MTTINEKEIINMQDLANEIQPILFNGIMAEDFENWECINGNEYDEEIQDYAFVFQTYLVNKIGADLLCNTNELVYYNAEKNLYCWAITFFGTPWQSVPVANKK